MAAYGINRSLTDIKAANIYLNSIDFVEKKAAIYYPAGRPLYASDVIKIKINSRYDNLGSISVRFFNNDRINTDSVRFRIKKSGSETWLYTAVHKVDQFIPHEFFPFGFPPIENSAGNTYDVEIESLSGSEGNAITLSHYDPTVFVRHLFTDSEIKSPHLFIPIIFNKITVIFSNPQLTLRIFVNFLPFLVTIIFFIFAKLGINITIKFCNHFGETSSNFVSTLYRELSKNLPLTIIIILLLIWTMDLGSIEPYLPWVFICLASAIITFHLKPAYLSIFSFTLISSASMYSDKNLKLNMTSWGIIFFFLAIIASIIEIKSIKGSSLKIPTNKLNTFFSNIVYKHPSIKMIWSILCWPFTCRNWTLGFSAFFNDKQTKKTTYHLRNGLSLVSDSNCTDFQIIRELFIHDVYFRHFPLELNSPTIIDIGAHKGYFSCMVARKYPKSRIISIEPDPVNFEYLKENLSRNNIDNVTSLKYAVSNHNATSSFYVAQKSSVIHSLNRENVPSPNVSEIKVECRTLSKILSEHRITHVDILKMDIEGLEYDVLLKLHDRILSKIDVFMVEAHKTKTHNLKDLTRFFRSKGYVIYLPIPYENVMVAYRRA